jgi:hypothetical protein
MHRDKNINYPFKHLEEIHKINIKAMKTGIAALLISLIVTSCMKPSADKATEKEKLVKAYYSGFEKHDSSAVFSLLSDEFTFTSPNNDDHISLRKFKERCWGTNIYFKKVKYIKMTEKGNDLFLLVEINTTDDKVVRNVDVFSFLNGKISSIEVFFGPKESYPGNKN